MPRKPARSRSCSYVVTIDAAASSTRELRELAHYLSTLGVAGCDVVILDGSPRMQFERNARILRWVGRHVSARPDDLVRTAAQWASCEKVIVAAEDVRYTPKAVAQLCALLDVHEVIEPQDYLDPLPWWGGIDAARILVHRGIEPQPDHGETFAFRASDVRGLHALSAIDPDDDPVRRLAAAGAEVFSASDVFVRRDPGALEVWLGRRPRQAGRDFAMPFKSAFFFALAPLFLLLAIAGDLTLAGGYAGVLGLSATVLAYRGRHGARAFFPFRACLFAPLWILERSISVYWALLRKLRGTDRGERRLAPPLPESGQGVVTVTSSTNTLLP